MKQKRFKKKLALNKETVSDLNSREMSHLRGGEWTRQTCYRTCKDCDTAMQTCMLCPVFETEYETCATGWCPCN